MKKVYSKLIILMSICIIVASSFMLDSAKAEASNTINGMGTFNDNSWNGVSLSKLKLTTDDRKKNLVHHYKVVSGKVLDVVTGKAVKGLKVCADAPTYFVGDNITRIACNSNWNETIEAIIDYNESKLGDNYPVFNSYIPSWIEPAPNTSFNMKFSGGHYQLKFERAAVDPYERHWTTVNSNFFRNDG